MYAAPLSGGSPTARAAMSATINSTGTAFYYGGRARQGSDTQYVSSSSSYIKLWLIISCFSLTTFLPLIPTRLLGDGLKSPMAGEKHPGGMAIQLHWCMYNIDPT